MTELSLHILDLLENSTVVNSTLINLDIKDSIKDNVFWFCITDNGKGMSKELLEKVTDPYTTTRKTRKVGLGLPLIKMNALNCNGTFDIQSQEGKGTKLTFAFEHNNIDRPPMGDFAGVFVMTIANNENIRFILNYTTDKDSFVFDTLEVKEALEGLPMNNNDVMKMLKEMINENLKDIEAND
ncbi:MAG: ATP-binding protein [Bacteroidales bacterium]|jgi:hypothetical protein|nr:ATP-binding protein [Bacteroidales bacterium]